MNKRDKAIIESLEKFRVLDRDQIISLHFNELNQKSVTCNRVMKRLRDRDLVTCDTMFRPYNYFNNPSPIKKNSMKLFHYKALADFIIDSRECGDLTEYDVEVKLGGKGIVEPDIFMKWNNAPFFVEVQLSNYYRKAYIEKKLGLYKEYFESEKWKELEWQGEKKFFPYILIIGERKYNLGDVGSLKVFQAKSMKDFVYKYVNKKETS
jgi:hypothetical protein